MSGFFQILIAPDSFKGSASAAFISERLSGILLKSFCNEVKVVIAPLADGGEGSLEAIGRSSDFSKIRLKVLNPRSDEVEVFYLFDREKNAAYLELAQASGLGLVKGTNDIMKASTYGTGQMVRHAIESGMSKIYLFLGGSATCDAGLGIVEALGIRFYNAHKEKIFPLAGEMGNIAWIDTSASIFQNNQTELFLAVDVNNPFYGPNGASFVYSPQKGANSEQVKILDTGLRYIAAIIEKQTGIDLQKIPGSGAAGGAAGGLHALLGAKIIKGTDFIFNLLDIEEKVKQADLVISGEGKIDKQSLNNKLLYGMSRLTAKYNKKLWAICGYFEGDENLKNDLFIDKVFSLAKSKEEIADSIAQPDIKIAEKAEEIVAALRLLFKK